MERRQEEVRSHAQNGKRNKGEEIMLRVSEIECEFLAEMIADGVQFSFADSPFTRPILDPFLHQYHTAKDHTLLNLES